MDQDVRTSYPPYLPVPPPPPPPRRRGSRTGVLVTLTVAMVLITGSVGGVLALRDDGGASLASAPRSPSAQPAEPTPEPTTGTSPPPLLGYERYENETFGYTVQYPENWVLNETPNGRNVIFSRGLTTSVNVIVTRNLFGTPEQVLKVGWMALKQRMHDLEEIDRIDGLSVDRFPAASMEYRGRLPQLRRVPLHFLQVVVVDGRTAYLFTYGAVARDFDDHRAEAQAIIDSFRLTA